MINSNSMFEELIPTGNIGVISSLSLAKELTGYYDRMERQCGNDVLMLTQAEGMFDWARENGIGMADRATLAETIDLAMADKTFLGFVKNGAISRLLSIHPPPRRRNGNCDAPRCRQNGIGNA